MEDNQRQEQAAEQSNKNGSAPLTLQQKILERAKRIPKEDREMFPPDFTENLDYYLYGMPKKSP